METKTRDLLERGVFVTPGESLTVAWGPLQWRRWRSVAVSSLCLSRLTCLLDGRASCGLKQLLEPRHCLLLSIHNTLSLLPPFFFLFLFVNYNFVFISSEHFLDGKGLSFSLSL